MIEIHDFNLSTCATRRRHHRSQFHFSLFYLYMWPCQARNEVSVLWARVGERERVEYTWIGWFRAYWGCLIKRHIELTVATHFRDTFCPKLSPTETGMYCDRIEQMQELDFPCNHTNWHFDKGTMLR